MAQRGAAGRATQAQPVPAENLHATLCFIGAVAPEKLDACCAAAARLRGRPASCDFDALEYWEKPQNSVRHGRRDSRPRRRVSSRSSSGKRRSRRDLLRTSNRSARISRWREKFTAARAPRVRMAAALVPPMRRALR